MTQDADTLPSGASRNDEQIREILKERARILARPENQHDALGESIDVVEFRLAQENYAIERRWVSEVYPLKQLATLPCAPPFLPGLINVRGQILPVIDLKKFFDLPDTGITDLHVVLIVHANDADFGILADVVTGLRSIPLEALQSALPTLTGIRAEYLLGVTSERVVILDVAKIVSDQRIIVNEEVGT
jgi:purine-binding chemotaxis protein CheW